MGQGRENSKQYLLDNPKQYAKLEAQIRENAGLVSDAMLVGPDNDDAANDAPLIPTDKK